MTDEQIKHMVQQFLGWRLPKDFNPDGGVSAARPNYAPNVAWELTGTNLFNSTQAEAMVRHMVEGLPALTPATDDGWRPIETLELAEGVVVLVALSATANNTTYGERGKQTVHIATYEDGHWADSYSAYRLENRCWRVTHWMPLPEPPIAARLEAVGEKG